VAVLIVASSPTDVLPACRSIRTSGGDMTARPISTVCGSPGSSTVPTSRQETPSADS